MLKAVILAHHDTVATAVQAISVGVEVNLMYQGRTITVKTEEPILLGHKLAIKEHDKGEPIYKYGCVIGRATQAIPAGAWVHVHNLEGLRAQGGTLSEKHGNGFNDRL